MGSHTSWMPVIVAAVAAWWVVVIACGLVLDRTAPPPVTLEVTPMSRRRRWLRGPRAALWRLLSWAAFVAGLDVASLRWAQRAERLDPTPRPTALRADARGRAWDRTLASSTCSPASPPSPPPSAPRRTTPTEDEDTRRWERTLPWGTPSPLLTREGRGRPYPFVPLAPPLPPAAPRSSRRSRRSP